MNVLVPTHLIQQIQRISGHLRGFVEPGRLWRIRVANTAIVKNEDLCIEMRLCKVFHAAVPCKTTGVQAHDEEDVALGVD